MKLELYNNSPIENNKKIDKNKLSRIIRIIGLRKSKTSNIENSFTSKAQQYHNSVMTSSIYSSSITLFRKDKKK